MDDWAIQSSKMGDIYGNAWITIMAALADDSSYGIFPRRSILDSIDVPFELKDGNRCGSVQLVERPSTFNALSGRQWAFQEKEFAFRTFEFRSEAISFRCQHGYSKEFERPQNPSASEPIFHKHRETSTLMPPVGSQSPFPRVFTKWYGDLPAYTQLRLTFEDDTLPAVSGLAREYQRHIGGRYLAGLWENDFLYGLQWRSRQNHPHETRRNYRRAPSWSWVSVEGCIYYCWPFLKREDSSDESAAEVAKLVQAEVTPITKDPNGRVSGGRITLDGPLRRAQWVQSEEWKNNMQQMDEHNNWDGTALFDDEKDPPRSEDRIALIEGPEKVGTGVAPFAICLFDDDSERPRYVDCFLLTRRQGIMLSAVDQQKGVYRRIGFFRINGPDGEWQDMRRVVNIV
ncbi:MAG: hypothetical protein M1822_009209 [Bathelium mastoideum]|nr:MAG: hypothetical protein M1822_009209 [Bathelium mastoideum]